MARILLIGDVSFHRSGISSLVRAQGHQTVVARDGADGIAKLKSESPDCVVVDLSVPRSYGLKVLHYLRDTHSTLPVITAVSPMQKQIRQECRTLGLKVYWERPLKAAECVENLRRIVASASRWPGSYAINTRPFRGIELTGIPVKQRALFRELERWHAAHVPKLNRTQVVELESRPYIQLAVIPILEPRRVPSTMRVALAGGLIHTVHTIQNIMLMISAVTNWISQAPSRSWTALKVGLKTFIPATHGMYAAQSKRDLLPASSQNQ